MRMQWYDMDRWSNKFSNNVQHERISRNSPFIFFSSHDPNNKTLKYLCNAIFGRSSSYYEHSSKQPANMYYERKTKFQVIETQQK